MDEKELLSLDLPKWPQMKVTGTPVTREQALEIIRRTDSFFIGHDGNDHAYNKRLRERLGMTDDDYTKQLTFQQYEDRDQKNQEWLRQWGYVQTDYVHNSWISAAFIFGPYGWCHPNGTISFEDNVGKWPSTTTIFNDWTVLAKEFPFVKAGVTLMSGEESQETVPVVSFVVHEGQVRVVDPAKEDVHAGHTWVRRGGSIESAAWGLFAPGREHGLKEDALQVFEKKAFELGLVVKKD